MTNSVWVYADLRYGIYPQAALQSVYVALSVYGIVKWSRPRRSETQRAPPGETAHDVG